jgi:hypothetical protein
MNSRSLPAGCQHEFTFTFIHQTPVFRFPLIFYGYVTEKIFDDVSKPLQGGATILLG